MLYNEFTNILFATLRILNNDFNFQMSRKKFFIYAVDNFILNYLVLFSSLPL